MSATEVTPEPEHPAEVLSQIVTGTETLVQSVNVDEEVTTLVHSAESLSSESVVETHRAGEYATAQMTHEQRADENFATAEHSADEGVSQAHIATAEQNITEAVRNNVLANSSAIVAEEAGAKAASLEQTALITRAVQEEMTRETFALEEVENRTAAGVEQEIRVVMAAAEEDAATAQNLEGELKATIDTTLKV